MGKDSAFLFVLIVGSRWILSIAWSTLIIQWYKTLKSHCQHLLHANKAITQRQDTYFIWVTLKAFIPINGLRSLTVSTDWTAKERTQNGRSTTNSIERVFSFLYGVQEQALGQQWDIKYSFFDLHKRDRCRYAYSRCIWPLWQTAPMKWVIAQNG